VETNVVERRRQIAEMAERMRKGFGGPMTETEVAMLRDVQAFIDFAIRNGLSFALVLSILGHDINGVAHHGMSYDEARSDGFLPKVTGYSEINADSVGEPLESLD